MRVLQILGRSAGGIARHVGQLVERLEGDGLTIDVAADPSTTVRIPRRRYEIEIPRGPVGGHRAAIERLRRAISEGRYDVVHAHGLRAGIDGARAARAEGVGSLVTVHNLVHPAIAGPLKAPLYRLAETRVVRLADHVFAVSEDIATHLRDRSPARADAIEVLYLGIGEAPEVTRSEAEIRSSLGIDERTPLVVTAARLRPQKALHVLLAALARVPEAHLALLGEGPLKPTLEEQASALGISERVSWLGFREDVADYVAAAGAFCLSSVWEGVPLATQEAVLLGTPVVATDVGGLPELVQDRVSGRLVPPNDPDSLGGALQEVLGDPERARAYAEEARSRLKERFSTPRMLERLRSAYLDAGRAGG